MKIAYLITKADLGGAQVHLLDLMNGFRADHEVHLITGETGYLTEAAATAGIPCHLLRHLVHPIHPLHDAIGTVELARLLRRLKPDLLHAHTSKAGLIGRLGAKLVGCPVVFTAHTWCFAEGTSLKWRAFGLPAERFAARFGSITINVSEANRALALNNGVDAPDRLLTIHNGIPDVTERASPNNSQEPVIAVVARFAAQKNHLLLLDALSEVTAPYRVRFIGDGPTRPVVESRAAALGISDRVDFFGNRQDIPQLLARAHVFALPTNWEGFPLSILEGMRAGLPVIACAVGGVSEAVIDGETGILVPPHNRERFGAALQLLLHDGELRARMGAKGRQRYEAEFDIAVMLRKTLITYELVLQNSGKSANPLSSPIRSKA